ncbi:MAG: hypothetical protein HYY06_15800 [Deltaproteobacteria bacterium]|nr:hypothetical protein [Deltaproteobacteria bacterium]
MRILSLVLVLSTFAAGCIQKGDEFRDALPHSDDLTVRVPQDGSSEAGAHAYALIGQRAVLYQATRDISRAINGGVYILLSVLEDIVSYPPATVTADQATWGPHTPALSPLTWRMIVNKVGESDYTFSLDARPKNGDDTTWVAILSGDSHLVAGTRLSSGTLIAHCDEAHALDEYEFRCTGQVTADWDVTGSPRTVVVAFRGWTDGGVFSTPIDADYSYLENDDLSGEFAFGASADLDDDGSLPESIVVTSRWDASGAGRGDASASSGDIPVAIGSVTVTECWDSSFGRSFYTDSADLAPTEGDPAACVFADAEVPEGE